MRKNGFVNPYSYYVSRFLPSEQVPDNIFIDGIILVLLSKILGVPARRFSFDMTSMAPIVFSYAVQEGKTIAFLGGSDRDLEAFSEKLTKEFPGVKIATAANGFDYDVAGYANMLVASKPDFVVIGMGAPLQDSIMAELYSIYPATYFTCGGFITQSSKTLNYYPPLVNKLNLRFLFRAINEPHYRKRLYLYPLACLLFLRDALRSGF
jgi:N-acetylglucosaminyldiphosphoundecaprenol N-acetyl-beta-D-mannosaminyltransferase